MMAGQLTAEQIKFYRDNGYLVLPDQVPMPVIAQVRSEIERFREQARELTASDHRLDLEDSHTPQDPRIRRIKLPHTQSRIVNDLMYSEAILGPARDLIGPDIRLVQQIGRQHGQRSPGPHGRRGKLAS